MRCAGRSRQCQNQRMRSFRLFRLLTLAGTVLAGAMLGSLVAEGGEPMLEGIFLGFGVYLMLVGWDYARSESSSRQTRAGLPETDAAR